MGDKYEFKVKRGSFEPEIKPSKMIFSKRYLRARGNSELLSNKLLQQSVQYAYIWLEPIYIQTEQKVISGGCEDFPINPTKHLPKNSIINITKQIIRYSSFSPKLARI